MAERACVYGRKRDSEENRLIDEMKNLVSELVTTEKVPSVVEHEWWKHPTWHRGFTDRFIKVGNYIFKVHYSSHEAEDEKGIYYDQDMCIEKDVIPAAKLKIEASIKDIKTRLYGDPYFKDMAKRLEDFLKKI